MVRWMAIALAAAGGEGGAPAPRVAMRVVSADETGIGPILRQWKAEELQRQGGKFGSHGWVPWGVVPVDFDNDGDLDLLIVHHGTPRGMILKNRLRETGRLTFVNFTKELGVDTRELPICDNRPHVWDFDGDGWLDIAGLSDEQKCPSLFNLAGRKLQVAAFDFGPLSYLGEVADRNGDGWPDVIGDRRGTRHEFLYDPNAHTFVRRSFETPVPANLPAEIPAGVAELRKDPKNRFLGVKYLTGHDLNGDGRADLVIQLFAAYGGARLGRYFMADAGGGLSDAAEALGLPGEGAPVLVRDVTGDGLPDVLTFSAKAAGLYVNDGHGRYARAAGPVTDFLAAYDPYPHQVHAVDLDADGDADLVMERPRYGQLRIAENTGGGRFLLVRDAKKWDGYPTAVCDLDDDGLVDVIAGGPGKEEVTVYLNATSRPGRMCRLYPRMDKPNWAAIGAIVEAFRAGELPAPAPRPYWVEKAHIDATPIHIGLGKTERFDLRVTFPGRGAVEYRNVAAAAKLAVYPDGRAVPIKP